MIVIPWYVRMAFDCAIIGIPFIWIANNPTLFYSFAEPKNRINRKRDFTDFNFEGVKSVYSINEAEDIYKRLGFSESY